MKANTTSSNPYKVGDILVAVWGYSMLLVEFYEVTRTTACKVGLRQMKQNEVHTGFLCGETTPIPGEYEDYAEDNYCPYAVGEKSLYTVRDGRVLIPDYKGGSEYLHAKKWSGVPRHFNHCD